MMISIGEYDRRYRRRLALIVLPVLLAHAILLLAFARVDLVESIILFGYRGPEALRPEISVLNDRTPEGIVAPQRTALVVQNVFIEGLDRPRRDRGNEPAPRPAETTRPSIVAPEIPGDFEFRSYASRAPVPYRLDYVILRMVEPEYPADALAALEEGYVLVEAYISSDGSVGEAYVRTSYGPRSFEESSLRALRQFLFEPIREGGKGVSFWVSFLVRYEMRR